MGPDGLFVSAVSVLVVAQSSSEISEGLMNNPVLTNYRKKYNTMFVFHLIESLEAYLVLKILNFKYKHWIMISIT